jgi:hypothetical protein
MSYIAAPAKPGAYVDTSTPVPSATIRALIAAGKLGVWRYVPLPRNSAVLDISAGELSTLCGAGLAVGLVQHVRAGLWHPGSHDSHEDGSIAADHATLCGYPAGAHLWLDLESIGGGGYETTVYAVGWQRAVIEAGYKAGLYVGFAVPLHPDDLYNLPGFDCYWSDAGHRIVATRGCAVQQGAEVVIGGVKFDEDVVTADHLGGVPFMCSSASDSIA